MELEILKEEVVFDEFFKIYKGDLKFEKFDGSMSKTVTRYSFEKNDAVAVLIYHRTREAYILVKQFRYPPLHHGIDPWLTEIVAGGKKDDEDEEEAAKREVEEETRYQARKLEHICKCYVSPGLMSERVTIFFAEVDESTKIYNGGSDQDEDEDIELIFLPRYQAKEWMEKQENADAKTTIAIQWHLARS